MTPTGSSTYRSGAPSGGALWQPRPRVVRLRQPVDLTWAAADAAGFENLDRQIEWLAGILNAHGYPVERLARDLEIAADVVAPLRAVLEPGAATVRAGGGRAPQD